jgi:hypothetical protein
MAEWPIAWPGGNPPEGASLEDVRRAELLATAALRMLTLYRVGGEPITVMPCARTCCRPFSETLMPGRAFYPVLMDNGMYGNCWCTDGCNCSNAPSVTLEGPVGNIVDVRVGGVSLPPSAYRVEDGTRLVRLDGEGWPACAGDNFTVTYLNGYEVDELGEYVGGIMAKEYLAALTDERNCRLPAEATTVARQGMTLTFTPGLFPGGLTNIHEVDVYIQQWNPNGLKVAPAVYSPDYKRNRTVTG